MTTVARVAAIVLMLAYALSRSVPGQAQSASTLHVATLPIDTGAQVYYGADTGAFKKAGFDIEITSINSGSAIAAGVVAGTFDFAQVNIVSLAQARERNVHFVWVAPGGLITDKSITSALVVAKSSPYTKARDLNGKTIAINALGSIQQLAVEEWMDKNGADSTTAKFVELPVSQLGPSLVAGRVDLALIPEPDLDVSEHESDLRVIAPAYSSISPAFLLSAWVTSDQFAHDHPDIVKKFADVMAETARWGNAHHGESAQILTKYTKVQVTPTMARVQYAESFRAAQIDPVFAAAHKYGLLKTTVTTADMLTR